MKEFRSKIDVWLILMMGSSIAFVSVIGFFLPHAAPAVKFVFFGLAVFMVVLILAFSIPCKYVLEADHLFIQAGIMKQRIPYRQITHIELSTNPRSAPALSLQRVKMSFGDSYQLVSPVNREWFMHALREKCDSNTLSE